MKRAWVILLLLLSAVCHSQTRPIRFEKIGTKQGLSSQETTCIFQDHLGFIWIGTTFGLNRFDGINCKTYYHEQDNSNSLVHNQVLSITQDKEHNLWIGTQEGVSCLDPATGKFINYSAKEKGIYYLPREYIYTYVDKDDNIWMGHNTGVSVIKGRKQPPVNIPLMLNPPGINTNKFVTSFLHDSKDRFWASTSYGIKMIDRKTLSVAEYRIEPAAAVNTCQQIVEDRGGNIFAGNWGFGVLIFDENKKIFYSRQLTSTPYSHENIIYSILPVVLDNTDQLFLGSETGLIKIKTSDLLDNPAAFDVSKPEKLNPESISGSSVWRLIQDHSGNIWIASKGINKIDPRKQGIQTYSVSPDLNFPNAPIILCEDIENKNNVWLGMESLYSYNKLNNKFSQVKTFPPSHVSDMIHGKEFYWLATGPGLLQCNKKMEIVKTYKGGNRATDLNTNRTYSLCEDHEGKVWIGTAQHGVNVLDPASGIFEKYLDDTSSTSSNPFVNKIIEDRQHNIWIGTSNGLYRYNRSKKLFESFFINQKTEYNALADNILCIKETKDGKIYVGSREGLRYYSYSTNRFIPVSLTGKHLSDYISSVLEDANGILWLGTNNGMIQYDPASNYFKLFNTNNGLNDNDVTALFEMDSENNIYIGSAGKLTVFNPQQLLSNQFAPAPLITDVLIDNKPADLLNDKTVSIKYNQGIGFNFVSLNYTNPENNQYAYKLNGVTGDWVSLGNNRSLFFPKLSPGDYTLQLKATNNDGVWNNEITSFNFSVTPPFWKTWWFIASVIALVAAAIYLLYRYRLNQLLRIEKMRTRIATDLHDDIGATLSSISFYSEAVKQKTREKLPEVTPTLEKMGETSRSMVNSMSDIVWAINPNNDDMGKLVQRMQSHAAELCALKNINLKMEANEKPGSIKPRLEQRKNIYLIFKEALNNSLKYSQCSNIELSVKLTGNVFSIQIRDDGMGFENDTIFPGNGLQNMKQRADEINGELTISSEPQKGTSVSLVVKIT